MKVRLARTAGFCMGVRRAVEIALEEANQGRRPIVTFGPLIHNNEVLNLLADKGITAVRNPDQLTGAETVIIRAHGVPPALKTTLKQRAGRVLDATCPRVVRVQVLIKRYTSQGYQAIIVGDQDHAEVRGLLGQAQGRGTVVSTRQEVAALP
ncbi:MAG: 4-hydroxy-3-methylbut-2-enyl diphosphate reductase, partial [Deltaproteobacteria bacterium]|nr:4-hydroxy-3-methylbut-2-enyl diphosphate reductase [Deltaproteobacteria bacterium]